MISLGEAEILLNVGLRQGGGPFRSLGAFPLAICRASWNRPGALFNRYDGEGALNETTDCPAAPLARVSGGLRSYRKAIGTSTATAHLNLGLPSSGSATGTATANASLSVIIGMSGQAVGFSTVSAALQLILNLVGTSTGTSLATADLHGLLAMSGSATGQAITAADLKGIVNLSGRSSTEETLSPTALARAVWAAVAASNNDPDTMGELLNDVAQAQGANPLTLLQFLTYKDE